MAGVGNAPQAPVAPQGTEQIPMSPETVRQWWARIELDRARRTRESHTWKRLLQAYLPPSATTSSQALNSNIHFRDTHLKIAEVWAQMPELQLTPLQPLTGIVDPQTGQPVDASDVVSVKRAVLNKLLGRDGANVDLAILEALFDIFATDRKSTRLNSSHRL